MDRINHRPLIDPVANRTAPEAIRRRPVSAEYIINNSPTNDQEFEAGVLHDEQLTAAVDKPTRNFDMGSISPDEIQETVDEATTYNLDAGGPTRTLQLGEAARKLL